MTSLLLFAWLLSVVIWQLHRIGWVIYCMSMDQLDVNNPARIEARSDTSPEDRAKALAEWRATDKHKTEWVHGH